MKRIIFLLIFPCTSLASSFCENFSAKTENQMALIPSDKSGAQVIGHGRLYFFTAPHSRCKQNKIFLIPKDKLDRYGVFDKFTYVIFFDKKGNQFDGWVKSDRLKNTSEGIGPVVQ